MYGVVWWFKYHVSRVLRDRGWDREGFALYRTALGFSGIEIDLFAHLTRIFFFLTNLNEKSIYMFKPKNPLFTWTELEIKQRWIFINIHFRYRSNSYYHFHISGSGQKSQSRRTRTTGSKRKRATWMYVYSVEN